MTGDARMPARPGDTILHYAIGIPVAVGLQISRSLLAAEAWWTNSRVQRAEDRAHRRAVRREAWDSFGCYTGEDDE